MLDTRCLMPGAGWEVCQVSNGDICGHHDDFFSPRQDEERATDEEQDEVSTERPVNDLRLTWDWPKRERWILWALEHFSQDEQTNGHPHFLSSWRSQKGGTSSMTSTWIWTHDDVSLINFSQWVVKWKSGTKHVLRKKWIESSLSRSVRDVSCWK